MLFLCGGELKRCSDVIASAARAWTSSVDSIIDFRMTRYFEQHFPFPFANPAGMFASYLDVGAFVLTLITTVILAIGVKESSRTNHICTIVNLTSVASKKRADALSDCQRSYCLVIVISGLSKANTDHWHVQVDQLKANQTIAAVGKGGFLPFSFSGVLSGAATCFYSFVGFDLIATTGEETENPRKAIPISICLVLLICCVVYCAVSAVLTLIVPYYSIRVDASLPDAFDRVGLAHVKVASRTHSLLPASSVERFHSQSLSVPSLV